MQAALEPYGLELEHAENGEIAVAKAMASHFDLIFLDVVMPLMDGPTALREIRARGNTTPVVLVTSVSTAAVVAGAVKLGNVYYIAKPFTPAHIRAIATKLLKIDPAVLGSPPRVVMQHTDPALHDKLRKQLPAHVQLESTHALAQTLDLIEHGARELVLFETSDPLEEAVAIANVVRRQLPAAGIFALSDEAGPLPWAPDEGMDGALPRTLGDGLVASFLVPTFLRPLALLVGSVAYVTGFRGPPEQLHAYATQLARTLVARCVGLDETAELEVDLRRAPADADAIAAIVTRLDVALREARRSPSCFRLAPDMRAATIGKLGRVSIL